MMIERIMLNDAFVRSAGRRLIYSLHQVVTFVSQSKLSEHVALSVRGAKSRIPSDVALPGLH